MKHYHFIGIGGIGMGTIASLLLDKGYKVSGSDVRENEMISNLRIKGATVYVGHQMSNIKGADCVVHSSAIRMTNPEMIEAVSSGKKVLKRAQVLAELVNNEIGITVAGAHGKTTTSSLVSYMLLKADLNPTTAVGGIIHEEMCSANLGHGKYMVAEVDESDGSFLYFKPHYSIITNIDQEHMDYYKSWDNLCATYEEFINKTNPDGLVIYCGDNKPLKELIKYCSVNAISYGLSSRNDIYAKHIRQHDMQTTFDCIVKGKNFGKFLLNLPGEHNVCNALATISLGIQLGLTFTVIQDALQNFPGVRRRFQKKGELNGAIVIDDYAHHPTEINMTLHAAHALKAKRVVVVFQPHRYSRTKLLLNDFAEVLQNCDELILTDVYAASEKPGEGVGTETLLQELDNKKFHNYHYASRVQLSELVLSHMKDGDCVISLGAGDITQLFDEMLKRCSQGSSSAA